MSSITSTSSASGQTGALTVVFWVALAVALVAPSIVMLHNAVVYFAEQWFHPVRWTTWDSFQAYYVTLLVSTAFWTKVADSVFPRKK